jgi:hypothetical protein
MRLKIELPITWSQHNNQDGPATFFRRGSMNAFQVSWAEYRGMKPLPEINSDSLKQMAVNFGAKNSFGRMVNSSGGDCRYGKFGTAVFESARHAHLQVWFVSDGRDHIMATHICRVQPTAVEVAEARQIAVNLALGPDSHVGR